MLVRVDEEDDLELEACWADVRGPPRKTAVQALVDRILEDGVEELEVTLKEFLLLLEHHRMFIEKIPAPGEEVLFLGVRLKFRATTRQDD